ncbi:MAG TPA: ABC transporter substrate-binding protein [Nocardioides sp.]
MVSRPLFRVAIGAATVLFLASCAGAPAAEKRAVDANDTAFPVEVTSCGHTSTIEARPTRAITLNQGATEVVLALGLEDQLAGTAYLDDAVPEKWREAYESVPVLSAEYPTADDLVKADPDLLYASYGSAFETKVAGTQAQLDKDGTPSYLSPFGCNDKAERPPTSFDAVWDEIDSVATAFGAPDRAEELRGEQQHRLDELARNRTGEGIDVLWFDSGDKVPFVGGNSGGPQLILDAVGARNIFGTLDDGWADGNWEDVVKSDPDVIVLADANWSTAADKISYLQNDPVLRQLRAVKAEAFVTIPFSESTPGVRLVDGAVSVSEQLATLDLNR